MALLEAIAPKSWGAPTMYYPMQSGIMPTLAMIQLGNATVVNTRLSHIEISLETRLPNSQTWNEYRALVTAMTPMVPIKLDLFSMANFELQFVPEMIPVVTG